MAENFPSLAKDKNLNIQEAEQTPNRLKKPMSKYIIIKCLKTKRKSSESSGKKS